MCSEAGGGAGHATKLAVIALSLWPEHPCQAILGRLDAADQLSPVCTRIDRGPSLPRLAHVPAQSVLNWAAFLLNRGFADRDVLLPRFDWWCEALRAIKPGLVVADFAPTATLAARAMGIRTVTTGAVFFTPPPGMSHYPEYLTRDQAADHGTTLSDIPPPDQAAIRDAINHALGPRGLPPLSTLPEVYACDLMLVAGHPLWDPYAAWRDRPLLPPVDPLPLVQKVRGKEVFIYFSTEELDDPETREALRNMPLPACLVAPRIDPEISRDLAANPNLRLVPGRLSKAEIVARARVILCAGQAGTLGLGVLAGIPVLALPVQLEQLSNAMRAAAALPSVRVLPLMRRGNGAILDVLADLWSDDDVARGARRDAARLRADFGEGAGETYRRQIMPLLHDGWAG